MGSGSLAKYVQFGFMYMYASYFVFCMQRRVILYQPVLSLPAGVPQHRLSSLMDRTCQSGLRVRNVGTCYRDTVVNLVFLFWFTEHITVVSWLCDETVAGSDMRLQSADLWCKAKFVSFGPSIHTVQCLCCNTILIHNQH